MKAIANLYWRFREAWSFAAIENRWKRAGHPTPGIAAAKEVFFRGEYLEHFRDFASTAYLAGVSLDKSKTAYIDQFLGIKTTVLNKQDSAMLRGIIAAMEPDEAFHRKAFAHWQRSCDELIAKIRKEGKSAYGESGLSPLTRRVLRGRA